MQALQQISWLPVLVSTVAVFVLGALWYTTLFSKPWVAARGYTTEQMAEMKKQGMAKALVWNFLANLVTCAAFSILVSYLNLHAAMQGAKLGVLVGDRVRGDDPARPQPLFDREDFRVHDRRGLPARLVRRHGVHSRRLETLSEAQGKSFPAYPVSST